MPLRAIVDDGDFFSENLTEDDRNRNFRCPFCQDQFTPVIKTTYRIKHFRHKNGEDHWEPETKNHLEMKMLVKTVGEKLGLKTNLEVKIGYLIADATLTNDTYRLAVECQCSSISLDTVLDKNIMYTNLGFKPLWIFGGKWFQNTRKRFLHKRSNEYGVWEYWLQRITRVERYFLEMSRPVFFYGVNTFWVGDFKFRWNSLVYGWYTLTPISFSEMVRRIGM